MESSNNSAQADSRLQQGHIEFLEIISAIVMGLFDLYQITKTLRIFIFILFVFVYFL